MKPGFYLSPCGRSIIEVLVCNPQDVYSDFIPDRAFKDLVLDRSNDKIQKWYYLGN